MSVHGCWIIGAIPDHEAVSILARFGAALNGPGLMNPTTYADAIAWWTGGGDREPFFSRHVPGRPWERDTTAFERLTSLVDCANPENETTEAAWDECLSLMNEDDGLFVSSVRSGSPVAALCYAIGAAGLSLLPGRFGTFLLPHSEVVANLGAAERALNLTGERRVEAIRRATEWMDELDHGQQFDGEDFVDGPLRVLRQAASAGHGVASHTRYY